MSGSAGIVARSHHTARKKGEMYVKCLALNVGHTVSAESLIVITSLSPLAG